MVFLTEVLSRLSRPSPASTIPNIKPLSRCAWSRSSTSRLLIQGQSEDQQVLWSLVQPYGTPTAASVAVTDIPHIMHTKTVMQDDLEAFIELFEAATEACD